MIRFERKVEQSKAESRARSGFVLIATVALTVFLMTLALGMINLSKGVSKRSSSERYGQIARANARMAMMLALGELQKAVGPDQRVTAEANLLSDAAAGKRHWVGVWNSEQPKGEKEANGEFIQWLVSSKNPEGVTYEAATGTLGSDSVELVGKGSVESGQEVRAQLINVADEVHGGTAGHYAWWVGDEGVKARVDLTNEQDDIFFATQGTQRAALEVVDGFSEQPDEEIKKLITSPSVSKMAQTQGASAPKYFHDLTVHSMSLMTDVRRGGLKMDLSALFEMTDSDYEAIDPAEYADFVNVNTPISSSRTVEKGLLWYEDGVYGPTMDTLRNHYRMYKRNLGSLENPGFAARSSFPNKSEFGRFMWRRTAAMHAWGGHLLTDPSVSATLKMKWQPDVFPTTRLSYGNMTPYLHRVIMYMSLESQLVDDGGDPNNLSNNLYDLELKFQPMVFVHNPYNVSMRVHAMRYVKDIGETYIGVRHTNNAGVVTFEDRIHLKSLFDVVNASTSGITRNEQQARFETRQAYTFAPGEIKVFVPNGPAEWSGGAELVELSNGYDPAVDALTLNLFTDEVKEMLDTVDGLHTPDLEKDDPNYVERDGWDILLEAFRGVQGNMQMRTVMGWAGFDKEDFEIFEPERGEWNAVYSSMSQWRTQRSSGPLIGKNWLYLKDLVFAPDYYVSEMQTTTPVMVEDRFIQASKYKRFYTEKGSLNGAFSNTTGAPAFVLGNPVASTDSAEYGISQTGRIPGGGILSHVVHGYTNVGDIGYGYLQDAFTDNYSTWGSAIGADGERYTSILEIPTSPLLSLGALQHVNLAVEAHQPALAIGNSYPSMLLTDHKAVIDTFKGRTLYDLSYFTNQAIWDSYFFSSISPRSSDPSFASEEDPTADIQAVIDAFVRADGLLGNSRMQFIASEADASMELADYKTAAAHLGLNGGFNVNSTSVAAWRAFLAGYRNAQMNTLNGADSIGDHSAFPRLSMSLEGAIKKPQVQDEEAWSSFAKLDDSQIQKLAEEIVNQNRERCQKGGRAQPYLSMGQFVNRMLDGNSEQQQRGALQAAIDESGINGALEASGDYEASTVRGKDKVFKGDAKNVKIPATASAPSFVLQSDVLQALGAAMTVRSDTFVIRTYGDAVDHKGKRRAQAWCEAVVQRVPTPVESDTGNFWLPKNKKLGRKLKLISFRWLSADEV